MTRRDMDRQREYKAALLLAVFGAVLVTILMVLVFVESWQQETDATPEKLTIENPDPCDTGSIVIYANGGVYSFYGSFDIENDGKDGNEIIMTLDGYMEAGYPHGEPAAPEIYGP